MAKIKQGYKQTDIGVIPEDWEVPNIIENSTLKARIGWQGLTTAEYLTSGDYFLVTGTDISKGRVNWDSCFYVDLFRYNQDRNIQLKNNDILITKDGTIGKVAFVDNMRLPATLNSGVFVIRPKNNDYYPQFLFYIFNSLYFHLFLDKLVAGSTINHLYQKDFVTFKFPLPKPKEQKAIAAALSNIDSLIDELTKLIEKKRAIKEGVMQQLLSPKEGWIKSTLGKIAKIYRGASPRPIDDPIWFDENSSIGWVRISDVTAAKKWLIKTTQKLSPSGVKNSRFIKKNNLIMSICATVGRPIITKIDVCIHDGFVVFDEPNVDIKFLYYFLMMIEDDWSKAGQTGSQTNLNTTLIQEKEIYFPKELNEQKKIALILSDMDNEIEALEQNLSKYKAIKTGMMQQLLTGKIRLI